MQPNSLQVVRASKPPRTRGANAGPCWEDPDRTEAGMKVLARVVMWGLLLCFPVAANADAQNRSLEVGVGLICNSAAQVERYLTLHIKDQTPDAAIQIVNTDEK